MAQQIWSNHWVKNRLLPIFEKLMVPFWYLRVYFYCWSFKLGFRNPKKVTPDQLAENWAGRFKTIYWNSQFNGDARITLFTKQELTDFVWANEHVTLEERVILGLASGDWRERAFGMHLLIMFNLEIGSDLVLSIMEAQPEFIRRDEWHAHQLVFFYLVLNRSPKALAVLERENDVALWPEDTNSTRLQQFRNFKRNCLTLALLPSHKDGFMSSNAQVRKLARTIDVYVQLAKILQMMPQPVVKFRIDEFSAAAKARTSLSSVSDHRILRRVKIE